MPAGCAVDGTHDEVLRLETDVQPAQADHSFAGVVFDVAALCDWEVTLRSFYVAGQLGTVSVYTSRNGWCNTGNVQRAVARSGWGNANDIIDPSQWELVARGTLPKSRCHVHTFIFMLNCFRVFGIIRQALRAELARVR